MPIPEFRAIFMFLPLGSRIVTAFLRTFRVISTATLEETNCRGFEEARPTGTQ